MRVLVTGADGFVGRHLVRRLVEAGDVVGAACRPGGQRIDWSAVAPGPVELVAFEITDQESVDQALRWKPDAVIHLAAIASTREARRDPAAAWVVNAVGTSRLVSAAAAQRESGAADPLLLIVSSGEVYGAGPRTARVESDPLLPQSPYAASKVGAEVAAMEGWRRAGVRVVIARPFTHTGPGQTTLYVLPGWIGRLREAKASGAASVSTGNLEPVRDLLDVRDVVEAYRLMVARGTPGEVYNVSRGEGAPLAELFERLSGIVGAAATPYPDPSLLRGNDIPYLVGDSTKLRRSTGWAPAITLQQTLQELVNAQAD